MTGKKGISSSPRQSSKTVNMSGVSITHPNKVWWPKEEITKLDIARYYDAIAPHILPWLRNHPLVAERSPDGIRGECFFQKNFLKHSPAGILTCAIPAESREEIVHYIIGGEKKTLLKLVNLGCIAIHVMNCEIHSLDQPDWLTFDLDPSSGKFADAAKAANVLRKILAELRVHSYPKTSGGRGIHVLVPLERGPKQKRVRDFAHHISKEMVARSPGLITVEMSKSKRQGRVFADWLRNAFGQTIAAPYSARRRPGCPISAPLEWDEVTPGLDPLKFNIHTIEGRLGPKDPWADFWASRQRLPLELLL